MNYPHFKIGLLLVGSIAILGAVFYAAEKRNERDAQVIFSSPLTVTTTDTSDIEDAQMIDTDNDGLKDWEEALWGTDPQKADSDADGTKDNDEILANRNPLVKGPRDSLTTSATSGTAASTTLTVTDKFSRDFFAKYMNLKQTGQVNDPSSQAELVESLVTNASYTTIADTYTKADITTIPGSDVATLDAYAKNLIIVLASFKDLKGDETIILRDALSEENPALLAALDPILDRYKKAVANLKAMRVPEAMADTHIGLMNGFSALISIDTAFKNVFSDPLTALQAFGKTVPTSEKLTETLVIIKKRFQTYGVSFPL